nr:HIT domain-containing protein [Luteimicrobium subarcticum]
MVETPADHPGEADGLGRLWTPHRMVYIGGQDKPGDASASQCPFCRVQGGSDEDGLIVARGRTVFAILNLYPYNAGHLMLCPYRHVSDYTELTVDEAAELAAMTRTAIEALRAVYAPQGFNLGTNLGEAGGAGIAAHLHQHVVPRWSGDANFLPIVARTKAVPELLADTRARLAAAWGAPSQPSDGGEDAS